MHLNEKKHILITDVSLRDGNHAASHQINKEQIALYCKACEAANIPIVEVGHGNGLGASSLQLGLSAISDHEALSTAREHLKNTKLGIHVIPGYATIEKDLKQALALGVDAVRIACHCSEADITARHIHFVRNQGKMVWGVLMMSHMISPKMLVEQALKMETYGAEGLIFMDSSGHYLPEDVTKRVTMLTEQLSIPVGFHAHNNLGMGIANSIAAIDAGATMLDASARGFGAGAGNAQLEVLVAVLEKMDYLTGVDLFAALDAADLAEEHLIQKCPRIDSLSIVSGLSGVFSGFSKPVKRIADQFGVDPREIFLQLGRRKIVAGQEDLIIEVASNLQKGLN